MKVSIITATYNSAENITTAISSVVNQTYDNIEYIIIDGDSSDDTVDVVKNLLDENKFESYKIISEPDKGIYDALNKGIKQATGDIIGFVHSDDLLASDTVIENIVTKIQNENLDGVYGHLQYVQKDNISNIVRYWKSKKFKPKDLNLGWMPPHPTLFVKKEVYSKCSDFDTSFKIAADYDFILRIFSSPKLNIKRLDQVITLMRLGGASNKNIGNILLKMKEDLRALRNNKISFPWLALTSKNLRKITQFVSK